MTKELREAIKIAGKVADNWVPLKVQYDQTPGVVVCVAVDGKPKYLKGFGVSDLELQTPMRADALFRVASMSKMFTAVAIMQLQEKNTLRIDDKVSQYLPWFKGKTKDIDLKNVTVRQLLSHNAGIFRDGKAMQWIDDKFPQSLDKTISKEAIVFENAITLKYSNHGYAVLGAVIEKVSRMKYGEYVTKNIIKPLGLKNTYPDLPKEAPRKLVSGYTRFLPGATRKKEQNIPTHAYASATGFISGVKDLAQFLASLHLDAKKSVLSRESRKEMMRVHGIANDEEMYGLGLSFDKIGDRLTYGHSGGFAGYITNAIADSEDSVQVIALANTNQGTAWNISMNLMKLIYKVRDMKDVKFVEKEPYSGMYRSRWGDSSIVSIGNDAVKFATQSNDPTDWTILKKEKKDIFKYSEKTGFGSPGELLRFKKIKNGKSQEVTAAGEILKRVDLSKMTLIPVTTAE